ncbi:MAG: FAD/NAD(P)-binding oxidoreductase [Armatimonadota bacterium]|nr:FAD/NAD(P)-binding oxidoreductase [Armatimonadota bacterium]MDR7595694.1 FAD/NAD(P)-binding oxidoreductase [Armatimonadota bacterium]MDR7616775.1 FAD/NAD(P)-binding oxidoreductase [Armatimonadota bacterium]
MARIVVLGGGFGGLAAAEALSPAARAGHEVVVVERRETFFLGLRKLWVLAGTADLASGSRPLQGVSRHGARWLADEVIAIDPVTRRVRTHTTNLHYDYLVVALGAQPRPELVPGAEAAMNLYDAQEVDRRAREVQGLQGGRVAVGILGLPYKCPPAPYEAVLLLDDLFRQRGVRDRVELVAFTPQPSSLPAAGPAGCAAVEAQLAAKGIRFEPNRKTVRVEPGRVVFESGGLDWDVLLAVPPHRAPQVVVESGLAQDGWIRPDPRTLRTQHEQVFAVGDVVEIPMANGMPLPKAGVFAEAQARVAASWILHDLGLGQPVTFDGYGYCFIEVGGQKAAKVTGHFLEQPAPRVEVSEPTHDAWKEKRAFERQRLEMWL